MIVANKKYISNLESLASVVAKNAHEEIDQKRKYTNEPYIVHPENVAKLVKLVTQDEEMIAAAWLHDTVEDTFLDIEDINRVFGKRVAKLVGELTDVSILSDGNRRVRKNLDLVHTMLASPQAKTIKLADLIDNLKSIRAHDEKFVLTYLIEMRNLLRVLIEGNDYLYHIAYDEYMKTIVNYSVRI